MSLVKWIRKNNRKIMVFVVIFSMVSFVIGYTGLQILTNIFSPNKRVIAHYGDGEKIKSLDRITADNELNVLKMLMSEQLLANQGLTGALLSYVIFPDSRISGDLAAQLKQAVQRGQLQISLEELQAYFNQQPQLPEDMWILLKAEAYRAGYAVSTPQAKQYFNNFVVQMVASQNKDQPQDQVMQYANQVYTQTLSNIINKSNITENQIFRIFGDLLTVSFYANTIMDNETVTLNEIKAFIARTKERLDANFVKIDAAPFVNKDAAVSDADIQNQFDAFKDVAPNEPTQDNPFGFGYKLPKRVQVEYIVVMMDDVKSQIPAPTAEAVEEYYSNNIQRFQTSVPSDPNNPDSEKITKTKPFADVAPQIRAAIENEKSANLANVIFNEIKDMTEANFEGISFEDATAEQLQMAAGEYNVAAENILKTYKIPVTSGKTGWLSPTALSQDEVLGRLQIQQQQTRIPLAELLLSVSADPQQKKRRIGMPMVRMWQNVGPVKGGYYSIEKEQYFPLMAMVRVVGIENAAVPENVNVEYDTTGVVLAGEPPKDTVFSLKDTVKKDLRLKQAMDIAKTHADELAKMVADQDWDKAIAAYNAKYAADKDPNAPKENDLAVKLDSVKQQTRASQMEIAQAKQYMQDYPTSAAYMQRTLITDMLNNRLYDMLGADSESTGTIHEVIVFDPQAACYVVKDVTRQPATITDYLDDKARTAMQLNMQNTSSLALVHFSPENIIKRMNYKPKKEAEAKPQATEQTAADTGDEE